MKCLNINSSLIYIEQYTLSLSNTYIYIDLFDSSMAKTQSIPTVVFLKLG